MKKMFTGILLTLMVFGLILSCTFQTEKPEKTGTLALSFPMAQSRTLLPDIDMTPVRYDITGTGPDGATFSVTSDQTTVEIPGLDFGDWSVFVDAVNADEIIIGHGSGTCTVHVGETTPVTITVIPLDGYGSVDLTVNWNAGDTEYPTIEAQLLPPSGSPIVLPFIITGGNTGTCIMHNIPTGYYTLTVKLMDGNQAIITPILTMGAVEIVRIVKDETTFGTFDFTRINQPGGTIQVNIALLMADPIDVTLSGQEDEIEVGESMTVTASVPPDIENASYVWYINGATKGMGQSYTVSGLTIGVYRLDVTVFSPDGTRAGSASCEFSVVEPTPVPITGNRIYVSNASSNTISVIDGLTDTMIDTINLTYAPHAIAINTVTRKIYICNYSDNNVTVVDSDTHSILTTIPVGTGPGSVGVNSDTNRIYVSNCTGEVSVSVIDGTTDTVIATIPFPGSCQIGSVGVNPATNKVYVCDLTVCNGTGNIAVLDGITNTIIASIPVGTNPSWLSVNSVTNRIYAGDVGAWTTNAIRVIDGATDSVITSITTSSYCLRTAVNSVTNRFYVVDDNDGIVNVYDGNTNNFLLSVTVGNGSTTGKVIAVNSDTNKIYVAHQAEGIVAVIDGVTNSIVTTITVGNTPISIAILP